MSDLPECICPLIDTSTWGGKPSFVLGDPRGSGCPIHETEEMRNEVKDAEHAARYGERAFGGPISAGATYWVGENGPAPLVMPQGGNVIDLSKFGSGATFTLDNSSTTYERIKGLKDATFTFDGMFESGTRAGEFFRSAGLTPNTKVSIEIPASRWQAFKARLKRIRGLGWIPVRYAWKTQFVGRIEAWPSGDGFTISTDSEESA